MYPSTFGHVATCVYMSDENLEQRKIIKFCARIGKRASETLALLTLGYGEYAVKKSSLF
jgi:hypothetical protein